jgi:glycosyltransferase involved in cell wall biosynthesis
MDISVVFPAYNEEQNIRATIARSLEVLHSLFDDVEILIVDDASRDHTGEIAEELAAEHAQVRVIHNSHNMGQGESILRGFRQACSPLLIHNAMDYPFDLQELRRMLPLLNQADIVVAVRKSRAGYNLYRKFVSLANLALLRLLFGLTLRDYNFVQLYRKAVFDTLHVEARSPAFVTPEMLIRAHDLGYRIREVVVDYLPRQKGQATTGRPTVILWSLRDMFRFWLKRRRERARGALRDGAQGTR